MNILIAGGAGFIGSHLSRALLDAGHHVVARGRPLHGQPRQHRGPAGPAQLRAHPSDVAHTPTRGGRRHRAPRLAGQPGRLRPHAAAHAAGQLAGHVPPAGHRRTRSARRCSSSRRRRSTATRSSTRSRRPTGATSIPSVRAPATTRPSASARRSCSRHGARRACAPTSCGSSTPTARTCDATTAASSPRWSRPRWPGGPSRSTATVSRRAASATSQTWSRGLMHVLLDPELDGEVFNVGNPHEITVRELAEHIMDLTGNHAELRFTSARPGDPERRRPIIDKIQGRYGWQPRGPPARRAAADDRGLPGGRGPRAGRARTAPSMAASCSPSTASACRPPDVVPDPSLSLPHVRRMPRPRCLDHGSQVVLGLPAQHVAGAARVRPDRDGITGSPVGPAHRDLAPRDLLDERDDLLARRSPRRCPGSAADAPAWLATASSARMWASTRSTTWM